MSPDQMPRNSQRDAEDEPCKTVDQELIDGLSAKLTQANKQIEKLEKLIVLTVDDLRMRASEEGVVNISGFIWLRLNEIKDNK